MASVWRFHSGPNNTVSSAVIMVSVKNCVCGGTGCTNY